MYDVCVRILASYSFIFIISWVNSKTQQPHIWIFVSLALTCVNIATWKHLTLIFVSALHVFTNSYPSLIPRIASKAFVEMFIYLTRPW